MHTTIAESIRITPNSIQGLFKLLDNDISPSDSVRNLCVIFDSDFSFHKHVSNKKKLYASHAFTTYVISAEFGVTYLHPLLRQYQMP